MVKALVSDAKHGRPVEPSNLHGVELWLAGSILHTNSQRAGAVANITVAEYEKAAAGKTVKAMIHVSKHKTKTTGSAMITIKGALLEQLANYLQYLRPLLPDGPLLFPNKRGNPFDHLSQSVKQLGERFGLKLPTATEGRHTAATATAISCSDQDRDAVATTNVSLSADSDGILWQTSTGWGLVQQTSAGWGLMQQTSAGWGLMQQAGPPALAGPDAASTLPAAGLVSCGWLALLWRVGPVLPAGIHAAIWASCCWLALARLPATG